MRRNERLLIRIISLCIFFVIPGDYACWIEETHILSSPATVVKSPIAQHRSPAIDLVRGKGNTYYLSLNSKVPQSLSSVLLKFREGILRMRNEYGETCPRVFIMGGFVRDILLGRFPHDIDIILAADKDVLRFSEENNNWGSYFGSIGDSAELKIHTFDHWVHSATGDLFGILGAGYEGIYHINFPDFSFNRMLLGVNEQGNFYLEDPHHGYQDLFPEEGSPIGRIVGDLWWLADVKHVIFFLERFLRFAEDKPLGLKMAGRTIKIVEEFVRRIPKNVTGYDSLEWRSEERQTLEKLINQFQRWGKTNGILEEDFNNGKEGYALHRAL